MAATVRIRGFVAKITNELIWECSDSVMRKLLNSMVDPDGPSGADPNPPLTVADQVIAVLGGKIVSFDEEPYDPDVVY